MAASGRSPNYDLPYPLSNDIVDVSGDIQLLSLKIDSTLEEITEDIVGLMVSSNTETGIVVSYDDSLGKLNFALDTNFIKDTSAQTLNHQDHIGVTAIYNNTENQLVLEVTGGGGGGSTGSASLTDIWWLGI
jgi:hypothetical protein